MAKARLERGLHSYYHKLKHDMKAKQAAMAEQSQNKGLARLHGEFTRQTHEKEKAWLVILCVWVCGCVCVTC